MSVTEIGSYTISSLLWVSSIAAITLSVAFLLYKNGQTLAPIPFVQTRNAGEIGHANAKKRFISEGADLIRVNEAKYPAFYIVLPSGRELVLSGRRYADEIRNDDRLSNGKYLEDSLHTSIPGFQPFSNGRRHGRITNDIAGKLTRVLPLRIKAIEQEATLAVSAVWTDNTDWHQVPLQPTLARIITQLVSRVFLGEELCRNGAWIELALNYTTKDTIAIPALSQWPKPLRGFIHWFLPSCQVLRRTLSEARHILASVIERRRQDMRSLGAQQGPTWEPNLIDWIEDSSHQGEGYDPTISILAFHFAAIPTTTDFVSKVIFELCGQPDLIKDLQKEIVTALYNVGWEKSSVYNLKLMDSVMKEAQRRNPVSKLLMRRTASDDIRLQDGTMIPRGVAIGLTTHHMSDPDLYHGADKFDGFRFLRMRDVPSQIHRAHLVATSPEHMGFGHGKGACPGRFFATALAKVLLSHILLSYDFMRVDDGNPEIQTLGVTTLVNPNAQIAIRRRKEQVKSLLV